MKLLERLLTFWNCDWWNESFLWSHKFRFSSRHNVGLFPIFIVPNYSTVSDMVHKHNVNMRHDLCAQETVIVQDKVTKNKHLGHDFMTDRTSFWLTFILQCEGTPVFILYLVFLSHPWWHPAPHVCAWLCSFHRKPPLPNFPCLSLWIYNGKCNMLLYSALCPLPSAVLWPRLKRLLS